MDISLIENFQKQINTQFNEMIVSLMEQYQSEIEELNYILLKTTEQIKEKESVICDLQKQVEENKFEESNFNNVSIIQNLNKQIKELTSKNKLLTTSLNLRNNRNKDEENNINLDVNVNEEDTLVEEHAPVEEHATVEEHAPVEENAPVEDHATVEEEELNEEDAPVVNEDEDEEEEEEEEEVEVQEIEYKNKYYYVQNEKVFNKKKNGEIGKEVGKMVNGKPKLNKKKKKDKEAK